MDPRLPAALLAALALAGCETARSTPASLLHCDNGEVVEVGYAGDMAIVRYKNRKHVMRTAMSGSGARYIGDGLQWWTKGLDQGTVAPLAPGEDAASAPPVVCKAGPPAPTDPGSINE
jgi:membrane-bound inhibitor of C-type lysozyme